MSYLEQAGTMSRELQHMIGRPIIGRIFRRAPNQIGHLPSDIHLSEQERQAAVERETERREHEEQ